METNFTPEQLADPDTAESEKVVRRCVHCGFCTATCPTYVLTGDELDSPRGRIYLIKNMLEQEAPVASETVKHVDRCLSCLACMTTCPSGVEYVRLVDHARHRIEQSYRRPLADRALRKLLALVLTRPRLFRASLHAAFLAWPFAPLLPRRLRPLFEVAPAEIPSASSVDRPRVFPGTAPRVARVALLPGCAQQVLMPRINEATVRILTRHGCDVVIAEGTRCCGALVHHLGEEQRALALARANIDAWERERVEKGLDAIVVTASGCGTAVKDYAFMLRNDPNYAEKASRIADLACDVSEVIAALDLRLLPGIAAQRRVAYHSACSLQHGQKIEAGPKKLLADAGFTVLDVPESHLCCGSAGTYNLLQPEIANALRDRKLANIGRTEPEIVAAGNIGCIVQLAAGAGVPVVHTVELLDWATGGPAPPGLAVREPSLAR